MRSRIMVTFYTRTDAFAYGTSVDDAREWLRSRGKVISIAKTPAGRSQPGEHLDEIDDSEFACWHGSTMATHTN